MTNESKMIEQTDEYLEEIWEELQELIDDEAEKVGFPCPCCCADKLIEQSRTKIMRDVFEVSKANPLFVTVLIKRAATFHAAMADVMYQLMEINKDLFEEELGSSEKEE